MINNIFIVVGLVMAVYGFVGFVGTWLVPQIGGSRIYGPGILTEHMDPTRGNRTVMSLWYFFIGAYLVTSSTGYRRLSMVFVAAFTLCTIAMMTIRYKHRR